MSKKEKTTKEKVFKPQDLDKLAYSRGYSSFRTAKSAKIARRSNLFKKAIVVVLLGALSIMLVGYAAVFMLSQTGVFSIKINDDTKDFSLSSSQSFEEPTRNLRADAVQSMNNYAYGWLMEEMERIKNTDGSANGESYVAFTFYVRNDSDVDINYHYSITLDSATDGIDEAARIMIIRNDVSTVYAKKAMDNSIEYIAYTDEIANYNAIYYENGQMDTVPFGNMYLVSEDVYAMEARTVDKFTVVIWLEGSDSECTDNILGGLMKMTMDFSLA